MAKSKRNIVRIRYTLARPNQKAEDRTGTVEGSPMPKTLDELTGLLEHPWGEGARVTNVRAVDDRGNDLPADQQPAFTKPPEAAVDDQPAALATVTPAPAVEQ